MLECITLIVFVGAAMYGDDDTMEWVRRYVRKILFWCFGHKFIIFATSVLVIVYILWMRGNASNDKIIDLIFNVIISIFCGIVVQILGGLEIEKKSLPLILSVYNSLRRLITNLDFIFHSLPEIKSDENASTVETFFDRGRLDRVFEEFQKQANAYSKYQFEKKEDNDKFREFEQMVGMIVSRWNVVSVQAEKFKNLVIASKYSEKIKCISEVNYFLDENSLQYFIYWLNRDVQGREAVACSLYYNDKNFDKSIENIKNLHKLSFELYDYLKTFEEFKEELQKPDMYEEKDEFDKFLEQNGE